MLGYRLARLRLRPTRHVRAHHQQGWRPRDETPDRLVGGQERVTRSVGGDIEGGMRMIALSFSNGPELGPWRKRRLTPGTIRHQIWGALGPGATGSLHDGNISLVVLPKRETGFTANRRPHESLLPESKTASYGFRSRPVWGKGGSLSRSQKLDSFTTTLILQGL